MAYPVAAAAQTFANTGPTPQVAEPLTPAEQETCDQLYAELKPMATDGARQYVLARTPVRLQEAMTAKVDADWPVPPVEDPLTRGDQSALPGYQRTPLPPVAADPNNPYPAR